MKLWPRKRESAAKERQPAEAPPSRLSDGTLRALDAARAAAVDLHESRLVRGKIDRKADQVERETSKNGFVPLIRSAFGSGS